jgi:hypothetical protein
MNPWIEGRLTEERVGELRRLASRGRHAPSVPCQRRHSPRRGPIRAIGLALVRVGRFLAGPEPEGRVIVFRRADWGRPY